ncbi:MAG: NAD(P)H-hydrate dehydratase [Chloroflexi bacterium]|nr:NAD(P)H-hydrate dehydratase [Chloroflexota bacterium]
MKVVSVAEMTRMDEEAQKQGVSVPYMMENAGRLVAQEIEKRHSAPGKSILVLVGPGNNGGDGLVAARYLQQAGAKVAAYLWNRKGEDKVSREAKEQGVTFVANKDDATLQKLLAEAEIVIDALLGTGANRPIEGRLGEILGLLKERRNRQPKPFLASIDLPTGLNGDTGALDPATVPADLTVALTAPKRGFFLFPGSESIGELLTVNIGVPEELMTEIKIVLATKEMVQALLPPRPRSANKGTFGKLLVVAGSPNYTGAPYLAAAAATRVGTGLVTLGVAASLHHVLATKIHEATFLLLPHDLGALIPEATQLISKRITDYQALLLGPGLGTEEKTVQFVHTMLGLEKEARRQKEIGFVVKGQEQEVKAAPTLPPLVIDADGLNALAKAQDWWKSLPAATILTPHPGEMSRLLGMSTDEIQARRIDIAQEAAQKWGRVVVLKGAHTVITSSSGETTVSPFANPGLASAGTGDVLSGAIAGFLAQGLEPYPAAICGVYVHGFAGEMAKRGFGDAGMVASDLLPLLPQAIKSIKQDA